MHAGAAAAAIYVARSVQLATLREQRARGGGGNECMRKDINMAKNAEKRYGEK